MKIKKSNLADIITIISFILSLLGIEIDLWNKSFWIIIIIITIIYTILRGIYMITGKSETEKSETDKIACSPKAYWRFKIINKNETLLNNVHSELYHSVYRLKKEIMRVRVKRMIKNKDAHLQYRDFEYHIKDLLKLFHQILKNTFNLDLYVSLYISSESENHNDLILQLWLDCISEKGSQREPETYVITNCNEKKLENYATSAEAKYNEIKSSGCQTNSIYDYLLTSKVCYWLSNDLMKDQKDKRFYTSSKYFNEKHNYNSLAAFAIIPPSDGKKKRDQTMGILQFDTIERKVFSETECSKLMGLMAHYLNDILKTIQIPSYE